MREIRIDMDLELNLHGRVEVDEWTLRNRQDLVLDLLAEKLTHQFRHAMRETIAKQMGAGPVGPAELGEVRDLLERAMRASPLDSQDTVAEAYYKLRRLSCDERTSR
jgi:hypothetical protein